VEILKDNVVFKVYCPKLPFFNEFDEKMKKNLMKMQIEILFKLN
jgi:hypothetical protein